MNVLLIYPAPPKAYWPVGNMRSYWVPTGLAFLGAALQRAGHNVRVHVREEHLIKNRFDWAGADAHLRSILEEFRPDMVGLSVVTPGVKEAATIATWAKELCGRGVLVVAGGPHPTAVPQQMLDECPDIDVIVLAEGEETLVELAAHGPRRDVAGLVYRDDGQYVQTDTRANPSDLDSLGPPAYDLFDMDFYTSPNHWLIRWLKLSGTNIRTSRGCTNRCRFCAGHVVAGVGVRMHSVPYVLEQVVNAVERFGVEAVHFEDDTIGADPDRLMAICEGISSRDLHRRIRWDCCLRVDQAEPELLKQMKSAGCIQVEYGFESGSDEALNNLGKHATLEQNRRAVRLTREAGLRIFADIMLGLPGETRRQFNDTLRFLRWAKPEVIGATRLYPLPGTPIFDSLPDEMRETLNWGQYAYLSCPGPKFNLTAMDEERFQKLYWKFEKYVVRPHTARSLLRDAPDEESELQGRFARGLRRFALRHPIRALRVP